MFRGEANAIDAIDAERRAVHFKLDDKEIFQKVVIAFDLSHAGYVSFGHEKRKKYIPRGDTTGAQVQSWSCE